MFSEASVLTLCAGREGHLRNLLLALSEGSVLPGEVVLIVMDKKKVEDLPDVKFPVRQFQLSGDELPLAAARNLAARKAEFDCLIFLDVDCIPSRGVVENYLKALSSVPDGVFQGEVFYLPERDLSEWPVQIWDERLGELGIRHPSKRPFCEAGLEVEPNFGELWGLSFALHKSTFVQAGGFDENFCGYGGEETDFAYALRQVGSRLYRVADAAVFHQHHPISIPPLQHFHTIIRNAGLFREKWGVWCMDYWLMQFRKMRLIEWSENCSVITIKREPDNAEIEEARQPGTVRFS